MKKSAVLIFLLSMFYSLSAQEAVKQREVGLVFSNLDNFGVSYRIGTSKALWRFTAMSIGGTNENETRDSNLDSDINAFSFSVAFGREYRKDIVPKLTLRYGADIRFGYEHIVTEETESSAGSEFYTKNEYTRYSPGISLVLGLNYKLGDNFLIGLELLPFFTSNISTGTLVREKDGVPIPNGVYDERKTNGFSYGITSGSALLSLMYKF